MACQSFEFFPGEIPELCSLILATGGDRLTIRTETHAEDSVFVARKRLQFLPRQIPEFGGLIKTGRGQGLTIGTETDF